MTLVSADGFEFVILREAACVSGVVRRMLDDNSRFAESLEGRCVFEEIRYVSLCCSWCWTYSFVVFAPMAGLGGYT